MKPHKSQERTKERIALPQEEEHPLQAPPALPNRPWALSIILGLSAGSLSFVVLFALFVLCSPSMIEVLEPLPQAFYRDETYFLFSIILAGILAIYASFGFRRRWKKA